MKPYEYVPIGAIGARVRSRSGTNEPDAKVHSANGAGWSGTTKHFGNPNPPVCAAAVASHVFLMAQPPLLYQEGNCRPDIHSRSQTQPVKFNLVQPAGWPNPVTQ